MVHRWRWGFILSIAVLVAPLSLFGVLRLLPSLDHELMAVRWHFYIVSAVATVALVLSVLAGIAALRVGDARTQLLALGFLALSGVFLAHGLGSGDSALLSAAAAPVVAPPAADPTGNEAHAEHTAGSRAKRAHVQHVGKGLQVSARLSMLLGSALFALAVLDLPRRVARGLTRHARPVYAAAAAAVLLYLALAVRAPAIFEPVPVRMPALAIGTAVLAGACLSFAMWRFFQAFTLAGLPLQGAITLGMGLLLEAQLFMAAGTLWHLSWWLYHIAMLAGFGICVGTLLVQYRVAGDLGALVSGLFLRSAVGGLRRHDPRALAALSAAVAVKDGDTSAHLERVAELSHAIGRELGLDAERLDTLRWAGRLHDLGKIVIPDAILTKPGPLTAVEFDLVRGHSARGDHIARRSGLLARAAPAIRGHHERWDGTGYPDRLAGEAIPLEARIVAVADVYDALTSARSYKAAWTRRAAIEEIEAQRGLMFDPRCVDALVRVLGDRERRRPRAAVAS